MKLLVTGAAGFIGAHCVLRLLRDGHEVCGLDNFNDFYDPQLKHDRVDWVRKQVGDFQLAKVDVADATALDALFVREQPEVVIHLAAQAGVRYSLEKSPGLRRQQSERVPEHPRKLPPPPGQALDLCLVQFGVRRQPAHALLGQGLRRPSVVAVRRDQKKPMS